MDQAMLISSAEEQLRSFGIFLDDHDKKLHRLLQYNTNKEIDLKNAIEAVVKIDYCSNQEELSLLKLLESDRILNKTLLTFAHIAEEVTAAVRDAKYLQSRFLFIDESLCSVDSNDADATPCNTKQTNERILLNMSQHMESICHIQFLLQHCVVLGNNLLHQCGAFLACEGGLSELRLHIIFDHLADLLLQVLIFDEMLATSNFSRFWPTYKKTVSAIAHNRNDALQFCTMSEVNGLQNCLQEFEYLFSGKVFQHFLDSTFTLKDMIGARGRGQLMQQFSEYMKQQLVQADKLAIGELNNFDEPELLIRLNVFCVLFHDFCGQIDTKHVKHLLELNTKHQGVMLVGNIAWEPTRFLRKHAASLVKPHDKLLHDSLRQRHQFLMMRVQSLPRDCPRYCMQVSLWTLHMRQELGGGGIFDLKVNQFKELVSLILQGLRYAGKISFLYQALVHAHVSQQTPMTKQTLLCICKLIELLKTIQQTFQQFTADISKIMQCILQYLQYKILHMLSGFKKKIGSQKLHDQNVDALAAIKIAEKCMNGPTTQMRLFVTNLALHAANYNNRLVPPDQFERFKVVMERITLLSNFQSHLQHVCDTTFLYWHQSIMSSYLRQIVERKLDFHSFQYIVACANKCGQTLDALQLCQLKLTDMLKKSNFEQFRAEIISKLCAQVETFLRLEVHANLQLEKMNPFEQSINDYRDLISACPVELNGHFVILRDHVENYLSAMFYNLTTISLHNWKTYEEMRHLAHNRLSLKAVEDYLPNQTLEQGIDILEIMRNIHIFVSKYVYNMNSQIFVEQQSANKHLDSIGIQHVANSLRTHGLGVINTTVNFTYQFLRQKFYTFSQFLYDEQIRSRLMKELRSYAAQKQQDQFPLYPYERADAFSKDIRKLGLSNDGQTYMDLFRKVITHVGNAMGYIRLVRSGSIHANYSASLYLPKLDEELQFAEKCKRAQLHEVTVKAAENFESNVNNLLKSFSDSTDYFKLLLEAFQPFFQNPQNLHLKNFFLIVPPLTINYVEHMLRAKEGIHRRDRQDAVLFDDGFAMGLAYILKLLNQTSEFNSLQWFGTVRERFQAERRKIKEMLADINAKNGNKGGNTLTATQKSENEKLQQTLALTERRINTHQTEYNMLYYSLSSAKIFFQ